MMRNWRARRMSSQASAAGKSITDTPRFYYASKQLCAVTFVVDATDDLGLVWHNRGPHVVLVKLTGTAKLHPSMRTGMHLYQVNNQVVEDAVHARELCEQVLPGEPLTLLLWQPPSPSAVPLKKPTVAAPALRYVTATIYKERVDSRTGLTLETTSKKQGGVRIARLSPPAPLHLLRVGMRLLAVEQSTWFSHHSEAVPLIRSLPAGYCTFLFAWEPKSMRSNSMDASVATTVAADELSTALDASRGSQEQASEVSSEGPAAETGKPVVSEEEEEEASTDPPSPTFRLLKATLTPEQAQQVVLMEDDQDLVYLHAPVAHLEAGMQVVSVNDQEMASAGHYEHFLQTTEEAVTLCVRAQGTAAQLCSATAVRPSFDTKTGLILTNGPGGKVLISRVTPDSLFPTLQPGMQILSINGHDWFDNYQDAVALIRSLTGEITVVAQEV